MSGQFGGFDFWNPCWQGGEIEEANWFAASVTPCARSRSSRRGQHEDKDDALTLDLRGEALLLHRGRF